MLLDKDDLYELTHDVDARILRKIHSEARALLGSPSETWLKQKYKAIVEMAHTVLGEKSKFLKKVKYILSIRDVEMADVSVQDNATDPPLTQEELNALQPLSAPSSLEVIPDHKRRDIILRVFRVNKRTNDEAAARFKERLQPSEMRDMAQQ
jgi:hypothetical protein